MTTAEVLGIRGFVDVESLDIEGSRVFRARQLEHNRQVAIKVLDPLQEPIIPRRFDLRRKALSRFGEGPGVVSVFESGTTPNGQPYLVLPYFRIGSLADQLTHGPMPWHRAAELVMRAAETVAKAHESGVVLGDLKPSSIMLADAASPLIALYGMATRRFDDGSPSYTPAEVREGTEPGPTTDVYSLSLILAALVAGRAPNRGQRSREFQAAVDAHAPERIQAVIDQGIADNPSARYADAGQLARALAAAITDPSGQDPLPGASVADELDFDLDELLGPPKAVTGALPGSGGPVDLEALLELPTPLVAPDSPPIDKPTLDAEPINPESIDVAPSEVAPSEVAPIEVEPVIDLRTRSGETNAGPPPPSPPPTGPPPPLPPGKFDVTPTEPFVPSGGEISAFDTEPTSPSGGFGPLASVAPVAFSLPDAPSQPLQQTQQLEPAPPLEPALEQATALVEDEAVLDLTGLESQTLEHQVIEPRTEIDLTALPPPTVAPPALEAPDPGPTAEPVVSDPADYMQALSHAAQPAVEADWPAPTPDGWAPPGILDNEDEQIPFRSFDRQQVIAAPASGRTSHLLDTVQTLWFAGRRSLGGALAFMGFALLAGMVILLVFQDLQAGDPPASTSTTPPTSALVAAPTAFLPTSEPPALSEPPATHQTTTIFRRRAAATSAPPSTVRPATTTRATTTPTTIVTTTIPPTTVLPTATTKKPPRTTKPSNTLPPITVLPDGPTVPLVQSASVSRVRATSAKVSVSSPVCVTASFSYSAPDDGGGQSTSNGCSSSHVLLLGRVTPSLQPGTTYTVTVTLTDASGASASRQLSFTTLS